MTEAEQVMKRCQIGTRNYDEANNLHADCYRVIGKLLAEKSMRETQRLGQEIEQDIEPEQLMSDRINYGMSVTQGGKRIDPMSIYKEPEQEPVAECPNLKGESMNKDEALTLEALKFAASKGYGRIVHEMKITPFTIKYEEALAQPEQEPVGWLDSNDKLAEFMHKDLKAEHDKRDSSTPRAFQIPVYTIPPQRKPLTKAQILKLWEQTYVQRGSTGIEFARAIEAAHGIKEKNT